MTREETLIAYVDGELDAAGRARFEAEMAAEPHLARAVARHQALAARVGAVYAPVLDEAVPPQLLAMAAAANDRKPPRLASLAPWAAVAASLAVGVLVGRAMWPAAGPVAATDGGLEARGQLARALTTELAAGTGPVKVGLSLKTADGRYCRTFQSAPDRLAGLACRDDRGWRLQTVTAWAPPAATAYRQAGSDTPPEVLAAVDALGAESLDAAAERAARDRGWR
jgi:anti-sigma-K factor RskA